MFFGPIYVDLYLERYVTYLCKVPHRRNWHLEAYKLISGIYSRNPTSFISRAGNGAKIERFFYEGITPDAPTCDTQMALSSILNELHHRAHLLLRPLLRS